MTIEEIQQRINDYVSEKSKDGTVLTEPRILTWTPEEFLTLAREASMLGWGMTYRDVQHFVEAAPADTKPVVWKEIIAGNVVRYHCEGKHKTYYEVGTTSVEEKRAIIQKQILSEYPLSVFE